MQYKSNFCRQRSPDGIPGHQINSFIWRGAQSLFDALILEEHGQDLAPPTGQPLSCQSSRHKAGAEWIQGSAEFLRSGVNKNWQPQDWSGTRGSLGCLFSATDFVFPGKISPPCQVHACLVCLH